MSNSCVFLASVCSRSRHTRLSPPAIQEAEENKDGLQPQSVAEAGARVREKSLRRRRGEEAAGAGALVDGNAGNILHLFDRIIPFSSSNPCISCCNDSLIRSLNLKISVIFKGIFARIGIFLSFGGFCSRYFTISFQNHFNYTCIVE